MTIYFIGDRQAISYIVNQKTGVMFKFYRGFDRKWVCTSWKLI
jgi:hypothetical protein